MARAWFAVAKDVTKPARGPDIRIDGRRRTDQPRQRRDRRRCPHTKHQLQGTRGARARPAGFSPRRVGRPRSDLASGFAEDARGAPEVDIFRARPTARGGRTGHPLLLDDHCRRALDDPLPLLDGKTPRQAVKTKKGRAQVVGWLKLLENSEFRRAAGQGHNPYDTAWMWRELKVEDSR